MAHESGHYSEFSTGVNAAMQGFENSHEFLGIQAATGMDILGLSSKQQSSQYLTGGFLHQEVATSTAASPWPAADDSLRSLFSCEEPNRNLSLSIFNMKHQPNLQQYVPRDMLQLKAASFQQQLFMQQHFQLRNSKFLRPARELLSELCSLVGESSSEKRPTKTSLQELQGKDSLSSSWNQSLYSMDILELRRIKAKLLCMLEEVDKRYRKYCGQMRSMAVSIEAVCGAEAARVYTELASKAMSRHFRCLRDGIVGQIRAAKKAMEEKDSVATGPTRGETPRLKLLEQCMRQQRAFQQGMMEQPPWRPQRGLPERSVSILRAWLFEHFLHPYPNDVDKHILARQTGLTRSQVSNWFINARVRLWKPMVEEMYLEEMKELDNNQSNSHHAALTSAGPEDSSSDNPNSNLSFDQKPPLPVQLLVDSGSLSYVINSNHIIHGDQSRRSVHNSVNGNFSSTVDVGDVEDYFSYRDCGSSSNSRRTGSVSLTLGLQQHNGGGMSLSLLPNSHQPSSLLFSRDNIHGEQQVHYSILDGEGENQLPYRDLMGAHHQLLHDLAR